MAWKLKSNSLKFKRIIKLQDKIDKIKNQQRKIANSIKDKEDWNRVVRWINIH